MVKDVIKSLVFAAVIALAINIFIKPVIVRGPSMEPTFRDGDFLIVDKNEDIDRDDVIVFKQDGTYLIKRVIAKEGDRIFVDGNTEHVNDDKYKDAIAVGQDEWFVMGDNRNNSYDSREFGCIKSDDIVGVVAVRLFPHPQKHFELNNSADK